MNMQRTSPLAVLAFAAGGVAVGLLLQMMRSSRGAPPLVPPLTLAATLLVIAAVLIVLAILLRTAVRQRAEQRPGRRPVNPFHAVRLLAGARAGQFAGALFAGLGAGSILQVLTRSVPPPAAIWLPMLFVLVAGVVLAVCGAIAELLCRVPPSNGEPEQEEPDKPGDEAVEGV